MKAKRQLISAAVLAFVAIAIAYGFWPRAVPVDAAKASRGPLTVTVEEEGRTRVKERFVVSAPIAGYLRRISLEVGDAVKKGSIVAELEPLRASSLDPRARALAQAGVRTAEASLKRAEENSAATEAEADYARKRLERARGLFESGSVAKDALERAESESGVAEANRLSAKAAVKEARYALERARAELDYQPQTVVKGKDKRVVEVRTPVGGRVLKLHRESEGVVASGEPLIDIGDPAEIEVASEVLSADAVKIVPGTPVFYERWGGGEPLSGVVRVVEPTAFTKVSSLGVEEQRVFVISEITSEAGRWKTLGDGYRVEASFVVWEGRDVLKVPASALFRVNDETALFAITGGRAELKKVKVGHRNGLEAEVISGLSEGEVVIASPGSEISDGVRVKARK